eukprot:gb/GECH01012896.1/.p1 GENE.gb/GECH01012896.1/~~gb/GECH01012896.1/.p1  ORF type:complete len:445 (+),score=104.05 gb/GECH01012896.1/:1-1335(+)
MLPCRTAHTSSLPIKHSWRTRDQASLSLLSTPSQSHFHSSVAPLGQRRRNGPQRRHRDRHASSQHRHRQGKQQRAFPKGQSLERLQNEEKTQSQHQSQQQKQQPKEQQTSAEERERQMEEREFRRLLRMTQEKNADERFQKMGFETPQHGLFYVDEHVPEEVNQMEKEAYAEEGSFYGGSDLDDPIDRSIMDTFRRDPQRSLFKSAASRALQVFLAELAETEDHVAENYHYRNRQPFLHHDVVCYTQADWSAMQLEYYKTTQGLEDESQLEETIERELNADMDSGEVDWKLVEQISPNLDGIGRTMEQMQTNEEGLFGGKEATSLKEKLIRLKELEAEAQQYTTGPEMLGPRKTDDETDGEEQAKMEKEMNAMEDMLNSGPLREHAEKHGGDFDEIKERLSTMEESMGGMVDQMLNNEEFLSSMGLSKKDVAEINKMSKNKKRN